MPSIAILATIWSYASGAIWRPNLHPIQVAEFSIVICPPNVTTLTLHYCHLDQFKIYHHLAPIECIANLAQVEHFATWCLINVGPQVELLTLIANWPSERFTCIKIWSSSRATCIGSKVGHQVASLQNLELPYWHYQFNIEVVSSSARVTSVKSTQGVGLTDGHPDPKIGPQVYLGPIKITPKV